MPLSLGKPIESLSVQQMRTFCGVYESGGYAGAEKHLGLSGPTMWEQIKSLESIYRVRLFQRNGRTIRPTKAGETLYELLRPLLVSLDSTRDVVSEVEGHVPSTLSLVTGVRMMLEELGTPLEQFRRRFPTVRFRLMSADNRSSQEKVLDGSADLALLIEPPPDAVLRGISYERLYRIDSLAVLPPRHRLVRQGQLSLADLLDEPLIVGNSNTVGRQLLEVAAFRLLGSSRLKIAAETDNSAVTIACARAGMGIGIIAGRQDGNLTRHVVSRLLSPDLGPAHVIAAYRSGRQLTQAIRQLLELLRKSLTTRPTPARRG